MTKAISLLLLCLFLAACAPISDPYEMIGAAQGYLRATQAAQSSRQQEIRLQAEQATVISGATQAAIEAESARLSITQTAVEVKATVEAATQQAYQARSAYYATSTAVAIAANEAQIASIRDQAKANYDAALWFLLKAFLGAILLFLIYIFGRALVQVYIVSRTTFATDQGHVVPHKSGKYWVWQFVPYAQLPSQIIDVKPKREIPINDWRKSNARREVLELIGKSIQLESGNSNVIPSDDRLGWSSEKRQRVIGYLKQAGCVYSIPGQATMVMEEIGGLRDLLMMLNRGSVALPHSEIDR